MAGQGHQYPGGNPPNQQPICDSGGNMRGNFGSGMVMNRQMQGMNNQMPGVMGGGGMGGGGMVNMGNQMIPPFGGPMQMANMMGQQTIPVASAQQSPGMVGAMGMGGGGKSPGMVGAMGMGGGGIPVMQQASMNVQASMLAGGGMGNVQVQPPPAPAASAPPPQQTQQNKEFNTASLCKFGQETVQDIVSRTQDVFQTLKAIQPPNGLSSGATTSNDKKAKMQEQLRTIRLLFKRLRLVYDKCNENCQVPGMEYTHVESLIPLKDEQEHKTIEERKTHESYRTAVEENKELTEQVVLKNKQLKEVINHLRTIIWEINVMLTMRRS